VIMSKVMHGYASAQVKRAELMYLIADARDGRGYIHGRYNGNPTSSGPGLRHGSDLTNTHMMFHDGHAQEMEESEIRIFRWNDMPWMNYMTPLSMTAAEFDGP